MSNESLKSLSAINDYRIDNPGTNEKRVVVLKNGETIFDDVLSVIAGDFNIYFEWIFYGKMRNSTIEKMDYMDTIVQLIM